MTKFIGEEARNEIKEIINETLVDFFKSHKGASKALNLTSEEDDFINAKEAAGLLKISLKTVRKKVSMEEIPYYKPHGILYFKRSELIEMINSGKHKPRAESINSKLNAILTQKGAKNVFKTA
jgi:excisionase family DNA binding protein